VSPTFVNFDAGAGAATHEVPCAERAVAAHAENELAGGVDRQSVNPTFVTLQRAQHGPVARVEERERAVLGCGQQVCSARPGQVRD
jgi:hypothetical protein